MNCEAKVKSTFFKMIHLVVGPNLRSTQLCTKYDVISRKGPQLLHDWMPDNYTV